MPQILCLHFR